MPQMIIKKGNLNKLGKINLNKLFIISRGVTSINIIGSNYKKNFLGKNIFNKLFITSRGVTCINIGPHNKDILSIIIGTLLGYTHLEKRKDSTRIIFEQCQRNMEYLT
jgi:hypothetical protein